MAENARNPLIVPFLLMQELSLSPPPFAVPGPLQLAYQKVNVLV